jgi:orotate phosphoribosyltransferase
MLNPAAALDLLRSCGAFLEGHFLLSSGLHSKVYVEKFRLLEHPEITQQMAEVIADHFRDAQLDLVVGPLTGGVLVAHEVAKQLEKAMAFPERVDGVMQWRRGFRIHPGQRVLVCEDVITTGKSVNEVIEAVHRVGGVVVGIGALIQRGENTLKHEPFAVVRLNLDTFTPENCPLCATGVPLEKRGSRT